jgi:hypothetical protein
MTLEADTVTTEAPRTRKGRTKKIPATPPVTDLSEFEERGSRRAARVVDEPPAEDPPVDEEEVEGAGEDENEHPPEGEAPTTEDQEEAPAPAAASPLARPATPPQTQPQPRPRKPRGQKVAAAASEEEELPQVPELRELRPATTQALKKLGTILGNKIPGAEHFEVWKRSDNGQLGYVGDYNAADLAQSQGMASFLNRYAKPQYGAGDYQIFGITSDGKRLDAGVVRILGIVEPTDGGHSGGGGRGEGGLGDMLMRQIERDSQRRDRELREIMEKKNDPTDPIEQLTKIHDFSEKLSGGSGKGDTVVAMVQAMGQQTATMLQVMTQQQQKSEERMMQLMSILGRKEADPVMMTLLAKLLDDKGSSAPMPPMVAPPDPMAQLQGIAAVLVALKPADNLTPVLLEQMNRDRMSTADIIGLVNQLRGEKGTDDFKKSMDNFTGIMGAVNTMRQQTEPSAGSMWGDILGGALSNRELVGSVAGLIRAKSGQTATAKVVQSQPQPQQQQPQQIPADVQARAADVARRRLAIEERKLAEEEARLGLTAGTPPVAAPVAVAPVITPPPTTATPATPEAAAKMQPPVTPGLPPNIVERVNGFIIAQDDGALVEATVEFLLYLSSIYEPWRGVGNTTLDAISTGNKEVALRYVRQLIGGLVKSNLLQNEIAERAIAAVDAHFEELVTHVQQLAEARADAEEQETPEDENEITPPSSDAEGADDGTVA